MSVIGNEKKLPGPILVESVHAFLTRKDTAASLQHILDKWKKAPLYQVASNAEYFLDFLLEEHLSERKVAGTVHYRWKKGTHDLNRVEGRAAWALEQLLGIQLSKVRPNSTKEELANIHREAKLRVEAFVAKTIKATEKMKVEKVEVLKARYQGKIKSGINEEKAGDYAKAMAQLLLEWPPLGKKRSDLQEIIGDLGESEKEHVNYRFDNGSFGVEYRFRIQGGVIRSVLLVGLE